jgi:hypothetical protein
MESTRDQPNRSNQKKDEHEGSATSSRLPCEYCMDLKRENFVDNGYQYKPFTFRTYSIMNAISIDCPYCSLIINAMQAFDISPLSGARWELRLTHGLVLRGDDDGKKHRLEFYITPGTFHCNSDQRNPFSKALTTPKH